MLVWQKMNYRGAPSSGRASNPRQDIRGEGTGAGDKERVRWVY